MRVAVAATDLAKSRLAKSLAKVLFPTRLGPSTTKHSLCDLCATREASASGVMSAKDAGVGKVNDAKVASQESKGLKLARDGVGSVI